MATTIALFVCDEAVLSAMRFALDQQGFAVVGCIDASKALDACDFAACDVAIIDSKRPDFCDETLVALHKRYPTLPIIALDDSSGLPTDQSTTQPYTTLHKPFTDIELIHQVSAALSKE